MKLSDYVAMFLKSNGVDTVFGYQGSSISHTIDSLSRCSGITFIETRHEQAAAFAANGYALAKNSTGVALSCSGPGATNLITGIADAFYDSLPCLFITGQVSVSEMKESPDIRQFGFQETDIVSIAAPITKYAVTVKDPSLIAYELEKAIYLMNEGRPGPVLLDIPHNVQRFDVADDRLEHFTPPDGRNGPDLSDPCRETAAMLARSERPVILLGGGSRALRNEPGLIAFIEGLAIPVVSSYRGKDVIDNGSPCYCGTLGVYGNRCANWAVKSSDLLIMLGSRLDGRQTGGDYAAFADRADVVAVDLDETELRKMPGSYRKIHADVRRFLRELAGHAAGKNGAWLSVVQKWRERYPDDLEYSIMDGVNPNRFLKKLSGLADDGAVFAVDVGQNQLWANASLRLCKGGTLLQSSGLGSMGFALPAAIGGYYASQKQTLCICGDGGFQMNLQELQTVSCRNIPVKIFVLNNKSLGLIRIYQSKALGGRFFGSVSGFGSPNYETLAKAYGIPYARIENDGCEKILKQILTAEGPYLTEVCVSGDSTCCPEPTYLSTIENQSPVLTDAEKNELRREANELHEH